MNESHVKSVTINGYTYHIAPNMNVWRAEAKRRWDFIDGWWHYDDFIHWHHVAGRYGILKHMIENSCPMSESLHIYEKCGDKRYSDKVHEEAKDMILTYFNADLYNRLMEIQRKEKFNPTKMKV